MTIYIQIKALAKRKPLIAKLPYEIPQAMPTPRALVEYIVRQNVKEYNTQATSTPLLPYLTEDAIADGEKTGKITFGQLQEEGFVATTQDEDAAVKNALTCYEDGIFRMFINDDEVEIDQPISLNQDDTITFIRLTMLAGRLW